VDAVVFTVGHSTLELDRFVAVLRDAGIGAIADVRRHPGSRRMPWFGAEALAAGLASAGIAYSHRPELGGRRSRAPDSPNGGWENAAFQGYADWMAGSEFAAGLARLEQIAAAAPTAVMCAEAQWWRCHRRLIADALVVRGRRVRHLMPGGRTSEHELTPFAVVADGRLTYPPPQLSLPG
jgi:uncharacterized protein (DUF488 family)